MFQFIKDLFTKKEEQPTYERQMRELLRENLATIAVDIFYEDDPIFALNSSERREYLLYFNRIIKDRKMIQRIAYLINKQAITTLKHSKDRELDMAGAMTMNGMGVLKDDVERLSQMFIKEEAEKDKPPLTPSESLRL